MEVSILSTLFNRHCLYKLCVLKRVSSSSSSGGGIKLDVVECYVTELCSIFASFSRKQRNDCCPSYCWLTDKLAVKNLQLLTSRSRFGRKQNNPSVERFARSLIR